LQALPYFDRLDYVSPMACEHAFALATEKLLGLLCRSARNGSRVVCGADAGVNHLLGISHFALDCGALTPACGL